MSMRLTTHEFIERSEKVHNHRYDYSKVNYVNRNTKVCIICPEHGEFWQNPEHHLKGHGCPHCANTTRLTIEEFIKRARKKHGNRFDYSKVNYIDSHTDICIICPEHGEFWQKPYCHLSGNGCPKCAQLARKQNYKKYTTESFIEKAKKVHGNKYGYSKVEYKGIKYKIVIICPIHGEFLITPDNHLRGQGCPKCSKLYNYTTEEYVEKLKEKYGDEYDYSITQYVNVKTKIKYICPKHGIIEQLPGNHMRYGCPLCGKEEGIKAIRNKTTTENFIIKARKIHDNKYDYSNVKYINGYTEVEIICPIHGVFRQKPNKHLCGQGCPICKESHLEKKIRSYLKDKNITYIYEYKPKWLKNGKGQKSIDFFLPDFNIGIECQGEQHLHNVHMKYAVDFNALLKRDEEKYYLSLENGVQIVYFLSEKYLKYVDCSDIYNHTNTFNKIEDIDNYIFNNNWNP